VVINRCNDGLNKVGNLRFAFDEVRQARNMARRKMPAHTLASGFVVDAPRLALSSLQEKQ
jgi:hypothetical protein